ncbi:MAG: 2-oxoglutarate ferredoxin oxidoreductase subunit alpha, partial [Intrasporangiaceae bacterium]|nr:2-oxoglutarate ferredoxin oxidoreductase subunit alpha [Intrasporangiaceae bacterium]
STEGPIRAACHELRARGRKIARVHIRHLMPLPRDLPDLLRSYETVILPENNMGQLVTLLRAKTLVDIKPYNRVTGQPFSATELTDVIETLGWGESA